jgi:hypothetical protein
MDLHNLCFSIWYLLQNAEGGKNQIYSNSTGLWIYVLCSLLQIADGEYKEKPMKTALLVLVSNISNLRRPYDDDSEENDIPMEVHGVTNYE